ncbi:MAG: glycosyltransferase [Chthoniobacterales bacterium]|nr:glycosyltransferase [Chthoniobacterales bacterium]
MAFSGAMQTSFLIPAFNEEKFVARAVGSVQRSAAGCGLAAWEVIVCDNASTDRTAAVACEAGATVVQEAHRQIARARNAAAAASSGRRLIWLDADAILTPEVLASTVQAFDSGRVCGGGAHVVLEGVELDWFSRSAMNSWNWVARNFRLAAGSYFFAVREGWEQTGGFDESVYAGEELGFALSLKKWGRARGLEFRVLPHAVPSSARKIRQYTFFETFRQVLLCAWPGNRARRDRCAYWYERRETSGG